MNVLVLKGGPDAEREVSLNSGSRVADALRRAGVTVTEVAIDRATGAQLRDLAGDVIFPVLHGPWGEGGPLQELLMQDGRPFVGCLADAARLCMDKPASKRICEAAGIPTPPSQVIGPTDTLRLKPPLVLKPCDEGSSVHLRVCRNEREVHQGRQELQSHRPTMMAESFIQGRELTLGMLNDRQLPLIEVRAKSGLYDYEAKYTRDDTEYLLDPDLPPGVAESIRAYSQKAWQVLGIRDVARMDFMVDDRGAWFLEANTMPGFTDHSLVPKAALHAGITMESLVKGLAEAAFSRRSMGRDHRHACA